MYSIWFFLLFLLLNIIITTSLRCNEDIKGSIQIIENCRACVIYIDTGITPRDMLRYRRHTNTIIRQKCALEMNGPLYGYDQTHCYCNSNLCNSNIQRCIYEIVSKRYFSCYHGTNSSYNSLEISKKCRSCRIRKESDLLYNYECLTFGEQEQKNDTHCTCQHPMCNQDFSICQRFQQMPSQARVNSIQETSVNSTIPTIISTLSNTNQTEPENSTASSPCHETKTIIVDLKNHANHFFLSFYLFSMIISFFIFNH